MKPTLLTEALKNVQLVIDNKNKYMEYANTALDSLNDYIIDEVEALGLVPKKVSQESYDLMYDVVNVLENLLNDEPIDNYIEELKSAISILNNIDYKR